MLMLVIMIAQVVAAPPPVAPAQAPTSASSSPSDTIVVTGRRLSDTERALADCIARGCPPKEEIDASLAHAENQFISGDYTGSRRTLLSARHRNARYAKDLPVDVADLVRANGRLASLNGLAGTARVNAIDSLDVLKGGLDPNDPRVLMQRLLVGDEFVKDHRFDAAREIFDTVARQARDSGQPLVEGHALFRTATVYTALASADPDYAYPARKAIRRIRDTTAPELAAFREAAVTLERRVSAGTNAAKLREIEKAELEQMTAGGRVRNAVLVHSPPINLPEMAPNLSQVVVVTGDPQPQWIDVSFFVKPDGSVRDVDTVRRSDNARGNWIELVQKSVSDRLYQPLAMKPDAPGLRRIERYSLIFDVSSSTGSRMRIRSPIPRIEMTDLTVDSTAG